jgi:hypothetical protein
MNFGQKITLTYKVAIFVSMVFVLLNSNFSFYAQQVNWSGQEKIPDYYDSTEEPPYLIADQNHVIHAFNSQPLDLRSEDSPKAIFYRQWSLESGWTTPNDILIDGGGGSINLVGIALDQSGVIHLVFQDMDQNLYYTKAYLAMADIPASWAKPELIAGNSTGITPGIANIGAIAVDDEGNNIVVIYSGSENGDGLYFISSSDQGIDWSSSYPIYLVGGDDLVVTDPELYVGKSGVFHAVWSTLDGKGLGGPGYYSRLELEKQTWSEPMNLDVPGIRTPSVIESNGEVFVSYHHVNSNGNWWRRSSDNGLTWTYPSQVSSKYVGTNGGLSFVTDSNGTLHAFFGERINDNSHGMWHIIWNGATWTSPEAVVSGPQVKDTIGGNGFDPRSARAVVSNGNLILVTWGTDGSAGQNGAWYSYKILDTPELPSKPLFLPTAVPDQPDIRETPTAMMAPVENTPVIGIEKKNESPKFLQNPQTPIILGIIPVVVLLIGIVVASALAHSINE